MNRTDFKKYIGYLNEIRQSLNIPDDEHSKDTSSRILKMWEEMFSSVNANVENFKKTLTIFPVGENLSGKSNNYICMKDIPFHSMCAHHWLPFMGKCRIEYLPNQYIIGLSKIPRIVNFCAKKPQVQENLTREIGELLIEVLKPLELKVCLYDVVHTCVTCRGIESYAETETNYAYVDEEWSQLKGMI